MQTIQSNFSKNIYQEKIFLEAILVLKDVSNLQLVPAGAGEWLALKDVDYSSREAELQTYCITNSGTNKSLYIFEGLQCVGFSAPTYVLYSDVLIWVKVAAVGSRRASNLANHTWSNKSGGAGPWNFLYIMFISPFSMGISNGRN
jgi:hypothetical protein